MLRDARREGKIDRLGAGAYRRSHRCLRHSISAVGPKIPSTEAVKTARAGPFTSRQTSSRRISWMFRRSSSAVATSREDRRSPGSSSAVRHRCQEALGNVRRCRSVLICSDSALNQGQAFCIIGKGPCARRRWQRDRLRSRLKIREPNVSCHCYSNHHRRRALSAAPRLS